MDANTSTKLRTNFRACGAAFRIENESVAGARYEVASFDALRIQALELYPGLPCLKTLRKFVDECNGSVADAHKVDAAKVVKYKKEFLLVAATIGFGEMSAKEWKELASGLFPGPLQDKFVRVMLRDSAADAKKKYVDCYNTWKKENGGTWADAVDPSRAAKKAAKKAEEAEAAKEKDELTAELARLRKREAAFEAAGVTAEETGGGGGKISIVINNEAKASARAGRRGARVFKTRTLSKIGVKEVVGVLAGTAVVCGLGVGAQALTSGAL